MLVYKTKIFIKQNHVAMIIAQLLLLRVTRFFSHLVAHKGAFQTTCILGADEILLEKLKAPKAFIKRAQKLTGQTKVVPRATQFFHFKTKP